MEEKITAWVARDEDGTLHFYSIRPTKSTENGCWGWDMNMDYMSQISPKVYDKYKPVYIDNTDNFPNVKWEDKEPTEVELTIKIKK